MLSLGETTKAMRIKDKKAVIVDIFNTDRPLDQVLKQIRDVVTGSEDTHECHVFLLAQCSSTTPDTLSQSGLRERAGLKCYPQYGEKIINVFYESKRILDNDNIEEVAILCSSEQRAYWTRLCELLFTPVHQWSIQTSCEENQESIPVTGLEDQVEEFLKTLPNIGKVEILHSPLIPADLFNHGFSTRTGGITTIPTLSSLNLHYTIKKRDPFVVIQENRRRLSKEAGFDVKTFHLAKPEHGIGVWVVGKKEEAKYDAIVTNQSFLTISAPGADCIPVLFADPVNMVCGAAHAGYRGTLKGVVVEVVRAMVREFGSKEENILVAMGPSLRTMCFPFSFDDASLNDFREIDPACVIQKDGETKGYVDLLRTNRVLLEKVGLTPEHIDDTSVGTCTACSPEKFFSFQRDGFPFGNQIGFIGILSN